MKRFSILLLALTFTAAGCDLLADPFGGGSGPKGVLKSEDEAQTFQLSNKLSNGKDISNFSINTFVLDPTDPEIIYLGHSSGIHKSEDGANTWVHKLAGIGVGDIAIDAGNPNIIYAAGVTGSNGKIIKSFDNGKSWIDIYTEASKGNAVLSIAISGSKPKVLIASLSSGEVIRSIDEGHTWQLAKDFQDRIIRLRFGSNNTAFALGQRNGLYKSTDSGSAWTGITTALTGSNFLGQNNSLVSISAFHDLALDQRQIGVIYLATEQGLIRSVNDGLSWSLINLPLKNAQLSASSTAVSPGNSNNILVSVGSILLKSLNGGITWETKKLPTGQTVRSIIFNPKTTNVIYLGLGEKR